MIMEIFPSRVEGRVVAPVSKSYAQRALAVALLAGGVSRLTNMGSCSDIDAAVETVCKLGAGIIFGEGAWEVTGGGIHVRDTVLDIGESGLATRLFTPVAALSDKRITITGHGSILDRPVGMMEEPLRKLGVSVSSVGGRLPLTVQGPLEGGEIRIEGSGGSQFLTGLLVALPMAANDSVIRVENLKSRPYVDMTLEIAARFGVEITHRNYAEFFIRGRQQYIPAVYNVEGDWSGASLLLVTGAVAGKVTVDNLNPCSLQADRAIMEALRHAGAMLSVYDNGITVGKGHLSGFVFDATDCPDLFPALAVLAANCEGESVLIGTNRLTHKESDRTKALAEICEKTGIGTDLSVDNVMKIRGGDIRGGVALDSFNDHRIAMAAACMALTADESITVTRAEAVAKSYPGFWDDLRKLQK